MTQPVDNLIFDVSGMLYRTFHAGLKVSLRRSSALFEDDDDADEDTQAVDHASFALHSALMSMQKYFNMFSPSRVVACFDRPDNWRKQYMNSDLSVTKLAYKGNRRQNQTPTEAALFERLIEHMQEFEALLTNETGIITLARPMLEADDCIAGWVQRFPNQRNIIASNDTDMLQLITEHTSVCNLTKSELVQVEDPKFVLFEKLFRGDKTDNIANAFPGIRTTKLAAAYKDPYLLANLLAEKYVSPNGVECTVGEVIEENRLLIDLSKQPPAIRKLMDDTIDAELARDKRLNFWKFSSFCNQRKLKAVATSLPTLRPLLVGGHRRG